MKDELLIYINGERVRVEERQTSLNLSAYLREEGLIGTKVVCEEGDCGACTLIIGELNESRTSLKYNTINSCIKLMYQLHNCHIVTIEAISNAEHLHVVQRSMVENFGSQCGYCTPGFVMSLVDLTEKEELLTANNIRAKLTGNLCRCTGYEAIIQAGLAVNDKERVSIYDNFDCAKIEKEICESANSDLKLQTHEALVFIPTSIKAALQFIEDNSKVNLVAGASDFGVQVNKRNFSPKTIMVLSQLHSLKKISLDKDGVHIGGLASWSEIYSVIKEEYTEFAKIIEVFASEQIRNTGTLAGNIINASPIGDSLPYLLISECILTIQSSKKTREVNINNFYSGYKQIDLADDEMLTSIFIPPSSENLKLYKISRRQDLDISIITAAISMDIKATRICNVKIAFGAVAATVLRMKAVEEFLEGKVVSMETFKKAGELAAQSINPLSDVRASREYRLSLVRNILQKYYYENFHEVAYV